MKNELLKAAFAFAMVAAFGGCVWFGAQLVTVPSMCSTTHIDQVNDYQQEIRTEVGAC